MESSSVTPTMGRVKLMFLKILITPANLYEISRRDHHH